MVLQVEYPTIAPGYKFHESRASIYLAPQQVFTVQVQERGGEKGASSRRGLHLAISGYHPRESYQECEIMDCMLN